MTVTARDGENVATYLETTKISSTADCLPMWAGDVAAEVSGRVSNPMPSVRTHSFQKIVDSWRDHAFDVTFDTCCFGVPASQLVR